MLSIPINNDKGSACFIMVYLPLSKEEDMTTNNTLSAKMILLVLVTVIMMLTNFCYAEQTKTVTFVATKANITAYTLKECYHNKGITSSGEMVRPGIVAVSRDLEKMGLKLGKRIHIQDVGEFVVKDRTSSRLKKTIDVYMVSHKEALKFGRKNKTVTLTVQ